MAGEERLGRVVASLEDADLDALVCTLPANVLLLTGYWPVVGTSIAVVTRSGRCAVLAPDDECELAASGWAGEVRTYQPGSLETLVTPVQAVRSPLTHLLAELGINQGRVGYEEGTSYEEATYAALFLYGAGLRNLLAEAAPDAALQSAAPALRRLRSGLTPAELDRVRVGCELAGAVFGSASLRLHAGMREPEVAAGFSAPMDILALGQPDVRRAGSYVWCMSGPNSAQAGAAYARTRDRELRPGDLVLVHCNSFIDGYWTDITRTYSLGEPDGRGRAMYDAITGARAAALSVIRPGARAAAVDGAARRVLEERGFGQYFTHGVGHNVGFSAISDQYPPRLHPASPDHLAVGMTFNIEPAIYIPGYGGIRHCDVVTVQDDGPEVLTPFQAEPESLWISS